MRAHLDNQIGILAELTRKSYDTALRLNELQLELARDLCEDFFNASRRMVSAGDPVQWSSVLADQVHPFSERMRSYSQQLNNLLGGAQVDLTRAAESFMPEAARAVQALAANAPMRDWRAGVFSGPFTSRPGGGAA
jgi:phasin family protein